MHSHFKVTFGRFKLSLKVDFGTTFAAILEMYNLHLF
jgi:hypothetical protein